MRTNLNLFLDTLTLGQFTNDIELADTTTEHFRSTLSVYESEYFEDGFITLVAVSEKHTCLFDLNTETLEAYDWREIEKGC